MRVVLKKLECIRTRTGEQKEEPCIKWRVDEDDDSVGTWCPNRKIRSGQTLLIGREILADRMVEIKIYDIDYSYNDCFGTIEIALDTPTDSSPPIRGVVERIATMTGSGSIARIADATPASIVRIDRGMIEAPDTPRTARSYMADIPYHSDGSSYGQYDRHYRLYFDWFVHPDDLPPQLPYCLQLIQLVCKNAQEWKDHVYIKVNGETVWGPKWMRDSGDRSVRTIDTDPIPIPADTEIALWEEDNDGTRSDLFGSYWLYLTDDYEYHHDPDPIHFHCDSRIVGDATYEITYRVNRRIENPDDPPESWRYRCG